MAKGTVRKAARKALLVGNPAAQSGRNEERIGEARSLLDHAAIAHDFLPTEPNGATALSVKKALRAKSYRLAIAMGGDGTISEVARGLITSGLARQVPLGLLPTGTANDIGHSFGLSSSESALERNVDVLAVGAEVDLDAGLLTAQTLSGQRQELFVDSVGFGFGPRILRMRNQERRLVEGIPIVRELYRDHLLYAASAVKALGESYLADDKFDVQVVADGKRLAWKNLNDLVIKGPRIYAGLWVLDPESRSDDGLFEVVPFSGRRDWLSKALLYLDHSGELEADLKELGISHSQGLRAARIEVTLTPHERGQVPAQVDGEEFPSADRFLVEVLPRALRLVVPAAPA